MDWGLPLLRPILEISSSGNLDEMLDSPIYIMGKVSLTLIKLDFLFQNPLFMKILTCVTKESYSCPAGSLV